jgi:DUF971 family protein
MIPKSIKRNGATELIIHWTERHFGKYPLEMLRNMCPCAGCKGETILLHRYEAPPEQKNTPGRYDLVSIQQVGSYAIQVQWGDGHGTGIYTWEYLLEHCQCESCAAAKPNSLR